MGACQAGGLYQVLLSFLPSPFSFKTWPEAVLRQDRLAGWPAGQCPEDLLVTISGSKINCVTAPIFCVGLELELRF